MFGFGFSLPTLTARRRAVADPDAAWLVSVRFDDPAFYTLDSGRVVALKNRGSGGDAYDFSQGNLTDAPLLSSLTDTTPAAAFANTEEFLECDALATVMNSVDASFEFELLFELDTISQQAFFIFSNTGSNNDYLWVGQNGTDDLRSIRRTEAGIQEVEDSAPVLATGTTHALSLLYSGGELTSYLDGDLVHNAVDYIGATGALTCNQFSIGCRELIGASLGMEGKIASFRARPV